MPLHPAELEGVALSNDGETPDVLLGHAVLLFYEGAHTPERRRALVEVAAEYQALMGERVTHYHPYESKRLRRIGNIADVWAYYEAKAASVSPDDEEGFDVTLYGFPGGEDRDEPTPVYFSAVGGPRHSPTSYLTAYFPASWPETVGYAAYAEMVARWCGRLEVTHGTAGLSLIFEEGKGRGSDALLAYPLLRRHPGLDYPHSSRWAVRVRRATRRVIRSVNWLTAIDDGFVAELGGLGALRTALADEACRLHPYDGGVVIQAGPRPELGDLNEGAIPTHYRSVSRAVRPLRFEDYRPRYGLLVVPEPLDDADETRAWLRRFD